MAGPAADRHAAAKEKKAAQTQGRLRFKFPPTFSSDTLPRILKDDSGNKLGEADVRDCGVIIGYCDPSGNLAKVSQYLIIFNIIVTDREEKAPR